MLSTLFTCAYLGGNLTVLPTQESFPLAPGAAIAVNLSTYNKMMLLTLGERPSLVIEVPGGEPIILILDANIKTLPEFFETCENMANPSD